MYIVLIIKKAVGHRNCNTVGHITSRQWGGSHKNLKEFERDLGRRLTSIKVQSLTN